MTNDSYFKDRNFIDLLLDGSTAPPQRKIGVAFLYEDTTTYLFSRTNYGKSLLVFQLGHVLATKNIFKKRNLRNYRGEIAVLERGGVSKTRIAEIFGVTRSAVCYALND